MRTLKVLEAQLEKARQRVEELEDLVDGLQIKEESVKELQAALADTSAWDISDSEVIVLSEELRKVVVDTVKKWLEAQ